jgi:hypothetical protein
MALVLTGGNQISFTFDDNNRNIGLTSVYRSTVPADTITSILDDAQVLRDALVPLSTARLLSSTGNILFEEQADEAVAAPESDVRRKLILVFRTSNYYSRVRMEIPSPSFDIETDGTNRVDPADPLVAALVAAIANPLGTGSFVSPTGFPILNLLEAYIDVRQRPGAAR